MKTNDQKYLELLYEQINKPSTTILDEEQKYIDYSVPKTIDIMYKAADDYAEMFPNTASNGKLVSLYDIMDQRNFMRSFVFLGGTSEMLTGCSTDLQQSIFSVYEQHIRLGIARHFIHLKGLKGNSFLPHEATWGSIIFTQIGTEGHEKVTVDYKDKERAIECYKDMIKSYIVYRFNHHDVLKTASEPSYQPWYEWRKSKLSRQTVYDALPELKGMF